MCFVLIQCEYGCKIFLKRRVFFKSSSNVILFFFAANKLPLQLEHNVKKRRKLNVLRDDSR